MIDLVTSLWLTRRNSMLAKSAAILNYWKSKWENILEIWDLVCPHISSYRVSLKKRSLTRLAPKVLNKAPRRSMRMKISPKHCKIFSTCDLGTKTLWQSSLWLLLAWSCGKYQARRAVVNKPSHWELWRVFNNQMKMLIIFRNMCQPIKFIILWILKIKCM